MKVLLDELLEVEAKVRPKIIQCSCYQHQIQHCGSIGLVAAIKYAGLATNVLRRVAKASSLNKDAENNLDNSRKLGVTSVLHGE